MTEQNFGTGGPAEDQPGGPPPEGPPGPPPVDPGPAPDLGSPPPGHEYGPPPDSGYADPGTGLTPADVPHKTVDERKALLAHHLQQAATRGMRVESQTDTQAVLVEGKPINHTLHGLLTLFTCLIWSPVYIILVVTGGEKKHQLVIDDYGNVHWQNIGKV
jgi:hypothetical protein